MIEGTFDVTSRLLSVILLFLFTKQINQNKVMFGSSQDHKIFVKSRNSWSLRNVLIISALLLFVLLSSLFVLICLAFFRQSFDSHSGHTYS